MKTGDETKTPHKRGARGCVYHYETASGKQWAFSIDCGRYPNGKRRQISRKGFRLKGDAQEALTNQLKAIHQSTAIAPDEITFGQYFREWLDKQSMLSWENSTEDTSRRRGEYALRKFGHIRLQELKAKTLQDGLIDLLKRGGLNGRPLSAKTVRAIAALAKQALEQAYRDEMILRNPMASVKLPRMTETEVKRPTIEEYDRILERLSRTRGYLMLVVFAADAACRRGEQLALQRSDIDLAERKVRISKSLSVTSKGMKIKCTKSGKERTIELSQVTIDMLREHFRMLDTEKQAIGEGYQENDLIFCTETGAYYSPDRVTNRISEFMREAGCEKGMSLHKLRHFGASYLIQKGVPITEVAARLGHATPEITLRVYGRFIPTNRGAAPDAFDGGMGSMVRRHLPAELPTPPQPGKVTVFPGAYATTDVTTKALNSSKLHKIQG